MPEGCSANFRQSLTFCHWAGEMISMYTTWYGTKLDGCGVSISTVCSSIFFIAFSADRRQLSWAEPYVSCCGASLFLTESNVKTTASALNALPSWNLTFLRSLKTHFFGSSLRTSHDSARPGTSAGSRSLFDRSQLMSGS